MTDIINGRPGHTFRIFVSSTFADFEEERKLIQGPVLTGLQQYCRKYGIDFQFIDLRWGVSSEAAREQKTVDICLTEIERCQQISPSVNFLALVGDRYGWQPLPSVIPTDEFEMFYRFFGPHSKEGVLLEQWYNRDDNAEPPVYTLISRDGILVDEEKWKTVESNLLAILRRAAVSTDLAEDKRCKYFTSLTGREIQKGIFDVPKPGETTLAFSRHIKHPPETAAPIYYDDPPDTENNSRLLRLKEKLEACLGNKFHKYDVILENQRLPDSYLETFKIDVTSHLTAMIDNHIGTYRELSPLNLELEAHESFAQQWARHFTGREPELNRIKKYLAGSGSNGKPMIVFGPTGSGKSALTAHLIKTASLARRNKPLLLYRFVGITPDSTSIRKLLESICQQVIPNFNASDYNDIIQLSEALFRQLGDSRGDAFLFIDAIDQLSDNNDIFDLKWLPTQLPFNVFVILTTASAENEAYFLKHLEKRSIAETHVVGLSPFSPEDAAILLDTWLNNNVSPLNSRRKLTSKQKEFVLDIFYNSSTQTPFFLTLLYREAANWKSFDDIPNSTLPSDDRRMLQFFLDKLCLKLNHGPQLVAYTLGYLSTARHGLSEKELLDLLSSSPRVMEEINNLSPHWPHTDSLPIAVWARLRAELAPYLTKRTSESGILFDFFHRLLGKVVEERFLADESKIEKHSQIADYFLAQPVAWAEKEREHVNVRRVCELPYHLAYACRHQELSALLRDFDFLMAKCSSYLLEDILEDYRLALDCAPHLAGQLTPWHDFFNIHAHIIRRGNTRGNPQRILLQLCSEMDNQHPLRIAAEKWLNKWGVGWTWLMSAKSLRRGSASYLGAIEVHHQAIEVKGLSNGLVATYSKYRGEDADYFIYFWDFSIALKPKFQIRLLPDCQELEDVIELPNNLLLTLHRLIHPLLWDLNTGMYVSSLKLACDNVEKISQDRLLIWGSDNNLYILQIDGREIRLVNTLETHQHKVKGVVELSDNRIVSWDTGNDIIIWEKDGTVSKHIRRRREEPIDGIHEIINDNLVLWNYEGYRSYINKTSGLEWEYKLPSLVKMGKNDRVHMVNKNGGYDVPNRLYKMKNNTFFAVMKHTFKKKLWIFGRYLSPVNKISGRITGDVSIAFPLDSERIGVLGWKKNGKIQSFHIIHAIAGESIAEISLPHTVFSVFVHPGETILLVCLDGQCYAWTGNPGDSLKLVGQHDKILGARLLNNGNFLTWCRYGSMRLWDSVNLQEVTNQTEEFSPPKKRVKAVRLDNGDLLTSAQNGEIEVLDGFSGNKKDSFNFRIKKLFHGDIFSIGGALLLKSGKILLTKEHYCENVKDDSSKYLSPTLCLWDRNSGSSYDFKKSQTLLMGLLELSNGKVLSWESNGTQRIWNVESRDQDAVGPTYRASGAWELPGDRVLSWSQQPGESQLCLWDVNTGRVLAKTPLPFADGKILKVLEKDGNILKYGLDFLSLICGRTGKVVRNFAYTQKTRSSFLLLPDYIITISETSFTSKGALNIWDASKGSLLHHIPLDSIRGLDRFIKVSDIHFIYWNDDSIELWNAEKGRFIGQLVLIQQESIPPEIVFALGPGHVGAATLKGEIFIWRIPRENEYKKRFAFKKLPLKISPQCVFHHSVTTDGDFSITAIGDKYAAIWKRDKNAAVLIVAVDSSEIKAELLVERPGQWVYAIGDTHLACWWREEQVLALWCLDQCLGQGDGAGNDHEANPADRGREKIAPHFYLEGHTGCMSRIYMLKGGDILSWGSDGSIRVWNVSRKRPPGDKCLPLHSTQIEITGHAAHHIISIAPQKVGVFVDNRIFYWDMAANTFSSHSVSFDYLSRYPLHIRETLCLLFPSDDLPVIYDIQSGEIVSSLDTSPKPGVIAAFEMEEGKIVSFSIDGEFETWSTKDLSPLGKLNQDSQAGKTLINRLTRKVSEIFYRHNANAYITPQECFIATSFAKGYGIKLEWISWSKNAEEMETHFETWHSSTGEFFYSQKIEYVLGNGTIRTWENDEPVDVILMVDNVRRPFDTGSIIAAPGGF